MASTMRIAFGLAVAAAVVLAAVPAAQARVITEFNYQFDQGGQLHDFSNGGEEGSKVAWQPGGAMESLGCLKVMGEPALSETPVVQFAAGDKTVSFHYFIHGYSRMRVRFNTTLPADRPKFGLYSQNFINSPVQDKWVFVQYKLTDLVGDAKGNPKGYPELIFKSITWIVDGGGPDSYYLLDNIRLGPPIEEKDIKVLGRSKASFGHEKTTLLDFSKDEDVKKLRPMVEDEDGARVTLTPSDKWSSTPGKRSLQVTCKADRDWTAFEFDKAALKGWEKYDYLTFDVYSDDARLNGLTMELWDSATKSYGTRCTSADQAPLAFPPIHKGVNHLQFDLRKARRNGKEGLSFGELRKEDKIDMADLSKVKLWFHTKGFKEPYTVYMDNVRLLQEGALETAMKIDVPKGALAFDFGENTPLVEGFTEASILDTWGPGKPFGFVKPEGLRGQGRDWPDPLTGDYVGPIVDDEGVPKPASFEFRVKCPSGKYLAWVCAGYFPYPNNYVDINVNGKLLMTAEMNGELFYSDRYFYRFLNTDYSEKPNALWKNVVAQIYPGTILETEVKNDEFYVKGTNAFISALVLLPADRKPDFDKMAAQIEAERIKYFYKDLYLVRPANEPCKAADKDLAVFAPAEGKSIMPWSGMDDKDAAEVKKVAAPGEAVAFQAALHPFRDIAEAKVTVSDLTNGPSTIPAKAVEVTLKRYISDGASVHSWVLLPTDTVDLEKDLVRAFWFRVRLPKDAAAGAYKGTITVAAEGVKKTLPVELQVYPVKLAEDLPLSQGFYYGPPDSGQSAMFNVMKDFGPQRDKLLKEQMEIMRDYGFTSFSIPAPDVTGLRGSGVTLNFDQMDKTVKAARDAGLFANKKQRAITYMLSPARTIAGLMSQAQSKIIDTGGELKLEGFDAAYTATVMRTVDWAERTGTPLVMWLVDEPRENPNAWNRNLDDTIAYCKLAGQVKGAVRLVTPMGDTGMGNKDYSVLTDYLEIVDTHPGKASEKLITKAMAADPRKLELWIYNAGADRLSNGLYIWRVGATGKHEWHFNQGTSTATGNKYPAKDVHNPFVVYEFTPYTVPAPMKYKGGLLLEEGFMTMAAGAADYRYLYTLEQAIAAAKDDTAKAATVVEAQKYLADLKQLVPVLPDVKNLEDLAAVGQGLAVSDKINFETIRAKLAEFTVKLQAK